MIIYLARPIDQNRVDGLVLEAVPSLVRHLVEAGHVVFDPSMPYSMDEITPEGAAGIERINDAAIREADCLVAVLDGRTPSIGVPVEIWRALTSGKPVVVYWCDRKRDPGVMLRSWGHTQPLMSLADAEVAVLELVQEVAAR